MLDLLDHPDNRRAQARLIRQWRRLPLTTLRQQYTEARLHPPTTLGERNQRRALIILLCYRDDPARRHEASSLRKEPAHG